MFTWRGNLLDGHQRVFTLNKMVSEGWTVGPIPVVEVEAGDEKEAKKMLLLISSRYGHVTEEGFYEFISMNEMDWEELKGEIDLPEIDWKKFGKSYFEEGSGDGEEEIVPGKDPNVLVRLFFHPGMWLGKREEILTIFEKMKKAYECGVKVEE